MLFVGNPWDAASEDVIDLIVAHIKRTRRWSRDGRCLRTLNRHWCAILTRHVVEVKPHKSRKLRIEDIRSLPRFQNLTALDAVPFEGSESTAEERCHVVAENLSELPHLTRLHVQYLLNDLEDDSSEFLDGIRSLHFWPREIVKEQLSKIGKSSIQKLEGKFKCKQLLQFLTSTPSIKELVMPCLLIDDATTFDQFVTATARLEALSINILWYQMRLNINKLQNLVGLQLAGVQNRESLEHLLDLPKLASLTLLWVNEQELQNLPLESLMNKLVSLKISCRMHCRLNEDIGKSIKLKHLTLKRFVLGRKMIDDFGNRSSFKLSLLDCKFDTDVSFSGGLPALKEFLFEEMTQPDLLRHKSLASLQHLEQLTLNMENAALDAEKFAAIRNLKNLTSLTIRAWRRQLHPFPIKDFEKLADLRHLSYFSASPLSSCRQIEAFMSMKMLMILEELHIEFVLETDGSTEFAADQVKALEAKAPHLKLTVDVLY